MQPIVDGRWRYYSFSNPGTNKRTYVIGRCLGVEEGKWSWGSEGRTLCALYENQDGWLCLCFEPEETPHQRANEQDGDYVRVQSTYTVWAPGRTELFNQYLGVLREIPRLIAPPPPEVEEMHRETGYDS